MPVVVTCPACRQKARVPEAMLGQPVTCPACAATFDAPAATDAPADPPLVPPPLPADADSLRAAKAGAGVQLLAHTLYLVALALFGLVCLIALGEAIRPPGAQGTLASVMPGVLMMAGFVALFVAELLNVIACGVSEPAPTARSARGWAVAARVLSAFELLQLILWAGWLPLFIDAVPHRFGVDIGWIHSLSGAVAFWLVDLARLTVLAVYWRAMFLILYDRRAAFMARRVAIAGPVAQVMLALAWLIFATLGAMPDDLWLLGATGALAVQVVIVLAGIGLVARLRRRLKAVVPAET